jgi:hypothetical protein
VVRSDNELLYAYVEGYDLKEEAPDLRRRIEELLSSGAWSCKVWCVDQQYDDGALEPGELSPWDLGVNLDTGSASKSAYQQDLACLYRGLCSIERATGRPFVLGIRGEDCISTADQLAEADLLRLLG